MMPSRWTFVFSVTIVACFLHGSVHCDNEPPLESPHITHMMSLLTDKIEEQIHGLRNLQYKALGNSPIEIGLKVIMNALEIFTIASGTHLFIPKQWLGREMQVTALASANLCLNLTTMNQMYRAIVNATLFAGAELLVEPDEYAHKAPERLFEAMEQFVNASSALQDIYLEEKAKVSQNPLPPVTEGTIDFEHIVPLQAMPTMIAMFNFFPRIRYFAVNSLFALWASEEFGAANEGAREHHVLAKSLVALATESANRNRVQELFADAVQRMAAELDPMKIHLNKILQIFETLPATIRKVFAEDMEINIELEAMLNAAK